MVVGCVQHYSIHFINKLGKSLEPFFHKIPKNCKKGQKRAKKGPKRAILAKSAICIKNGYAMFEPLRWPNFIPSFRKILRAVFEKSCNGWTDGQTNPIL